MQKVYFDGKNRGRIIAVAKNGMKFEQSLEHCESCGAVAKVMKPIDVAVPPTKRCGCANHN